MEAQQLADTVLSSAVWSTAESLGRTGHESELAFLLSNMYQDPSNPSWVTDRQLFRGKSAVDLVQAPKGLAKVARHYDKRRRERPVFSVH